MQRFIKVAALKYIGAGLILGFALQCQALAQSSAAQTFGTESIVFATEAQSLQGSSDHKRAIKRLKKGLKLDGLSAFETSTMYQMMGNSYYATKKNDKAIEAFDSAI